MVASWRWSRGEEPAAPCGAVTGRVPAIPGLPLSVPGACVKITLRLPEREGVRVDVRVKSKNCDVASRLKEEAVAKVEHATRFFDRLHDVEMLFAAEQNPRIAEPASVELTAWAKGYNVRAEGYGPDHRKAVDMAVERFARQLSRHKSKLVDRRHGKGQPGLSQPADTGLLPADRVVPNGDEPATLEGDEEPPGEGGHPPEPEIVRKKRFELSAMLPEDAALQLELLGHHFYVFTNAATGECNVLYRRRDGDFGLIEAV